MHYASMVLGIRGAGRRSPYFGSYELRDSDSNYIQFNLLNEQEMD